jgi:caa(3)-type oxidase subunit IV
VSVVWLFLVLATLASGWMPSHHHLEGRWAVVVLLAIAAIKARMIVLHYMELKHSPLTWRIFFEAWVLLVSFIVIALW